ncbi:MAG: VWA-like domain-containing protein [Candidatus Izemoplasmatales bacterium]|jgi:predicted metal-dependent peptidase|nr:VWA-like domain-containing protein [Candidatus Izemoplasmatales bacterium]
MNDELRNKLQDARTNVLVRDPFIGYVMQHFNIRVVKDFPTAATDGKRIIFGEKFLNNLTLQDTIFVLMHELLHIILTHPLRMQGKDLIRFNVACDIVVNDIIMEYGYRTDNLQVITGRKYEIDSSDKTAEEIYELLDGMQLPEPIMDLHPWIVADDNDLSAYEDIFRTMKQAGNLGLNTKSPALRKKIQEILSSSNTNDWKRILELYIEKEVHDYTYEKTDHRYGDVLLPSFIENEDILKNIWFLVDVSGSVSNDEINLIATEINRIASHFKSLDCSLSFFSTKTTKPIRFQNKNQLIESFADAQTTGGTDFIQIFQAIDDFFKYRKPELIIIFTDGYSQFPNQSQIKNNKIIWCITNKKIAPIGKTIHIGN